ncbi:NifB/NifX family molybdenum-iron cluster-binding protein [Prosthecochloris sp. HL-130-GSB]|uniref:Dinitrogenase iron-molybdenum cofactor biosynthesis protein n=1 Tax=Prosthecochloris aestuarii TaxID=1102 RepID=A0A831STQ1_PROAE|nr:NifB/NifX family molybdenum-iron cluster-binding protein [Prosthecochloris sp. HL-130-GSB]ARM30720.1 dinitrogenase iron-molybdenum cofactor biosynthesis protein [Prosthecochloris sp. HL-130-GSB]MBO8093516.1 NifB/NifX family molybdenum-iron cluster-binding protein [Prosthecochloris sp.]HED31938.1 dinitrogenase iron-molybdenum cofactor biosynthesis protein [Prosthecochloris aestuarii]
MIIAVPLNEQAGFGSSVCEHFGSAPYYGVFDTGSGELSVVENVNSEHVHGQCRPADMFTDNRVDAVVCNGIGGRAAAKLQAHGIEIHIAGLAPNMKEAADRFVRGETRKMDTRNFCEGHDCH